MKLPICSCGIPCPILLTDWSGTIYLCNKCGFARIVLVEKPKMEQPTAWPA